MNTRKTIFISVVVLLLVLLGAWWYFGFSLDFMRFFAAEPGVTGSTTTTGGNTGGTTTDTTGLTRQSPLPADCQMNGTTVTCSKVACAAARSSVVVGVALNIQAYGGTGGYTFSAPGGTLVTPQSTNDVIGVSYDTPGTKQVFVTAQRASDPTQTDVATCEVSVIVGAVTN